MTEQRNIAFALGGLAGNNAHGAGFLQAALDMKTPPAAISCTSGQILWVYRYLLATQGHKSLHRYAEEDIREAQPFPSRDWNLAMMTLVGKHDVFRFAYYEVVLDALRNMASAFEHIVRSWPNPFYVREIISTVPARTMVPLFEDGFFEKVSDAFNTNDDVAIMFNSFDPNEGIEFVHLNPKAQKDLGRKAGDRGSYPELHARTVFKDITPKYVKDGLWLYQYGFDGQAMLDGCYYRQIILGELAKLATRIYIARPINTKWVGSLPTSATALEDMKTEITFNGSYQGERDKVVLINKLLEEHQLKNYRKVELVDVEMQSQESFFDYAFEDMRVFDRARKTGKEKLAREIPSTSTGSGGMKERASAEPAMASM